MALAEASHDGRVATILLHRPEARNALSVDMCRALTDTLEEIRSSEARAVVVRGAGPAFCAGADFAAVSGAGGIEFLPAFEEMLETVAAFPLPTIASIQGAALGGGLQLATVCDFRIAADDAKLGIPAARLGIVVNYENVERLVMLVGVARAKEVLMTARQYTGAEATTAGLVNRDVPAPELERTTQELAAEIAALAPGSVRGAKRAIGLVERRARSSGPAVAEIDVLVEAAYRSADLREGIASMRERRAPEFRGDESL